MDLDQIFGNMEKASMSDKGSFFPGGLYTCALKSMEYRNGFKGQSFIAKFEVLESNNPDCAVGSTRSWIVKLDKQETKEQAMGDIKALIFALLGKSAKDVGSADKNPLAHKQAVALFKAHIDENYGPKFKAEFGVDAPSLVGRPVSLEATSVKTKAGGDFTRHSWSPKKAA
jgi:hypothetical protein